MSNLFYFKKNTSIFQNSNTARNYFLRIIKEHFSDPNITLSLDEINKKTDFWQIIGESEKIYELKLKLRSPNLFGGAFRVNELLKEIKAETNNDSVEISLKNDNGDLTIQPDDYGDALSYADAGGGTWEITCTKSGEATKSKMKSTAIVASLELPTPEESQKLIEDTDQIRQSLSALNESTLINPGSENDE